MVLRSKIEFVNHASVLISYSDIGILTDPWYRGSAFHKGWNLFYENDALEIIKILDNTTHIWISHEHPDHFSVDFFIRYKNKILEKDIQILFQSTSDKRVIGFLIKKGFNVKELIFNKYHNITELVSVYLFKEGFYDSGLLINNNGEKILNLNDCELNTVGKIKHLSRKIGEIDVLLTQFSYAAWKGGEKNKKWRADAAKSKIQTVNLQCKILKPKYLIPFASYIYFSNNKNFYLNDMANRPDEVKNRLDFSDINVIIMKPYDVLGCKEKVYSSTESNLFWNNMYDTLHERKLNEYKTVSFSELEKKYTLYKDRVKENNNLLIMKIARKISPIKIFRPIQILIDDLNITLELDIIYNQFNITNKAPMISMHSESLSFILDNSFGFDTLTVNGCFEELKSNGFINVSKSLAIENLNNLGINFDSKIIFNNTIILLFLRKIISVSKKLS